jgi:hypothetical protein
MVITKNYFDVPTNLNKILFRSESLIKPSDTAQKLYAKLVGTNYHVLNYYEFHILVNRTSDQKTNFSKLDDEFFQELSNHKHKICFCGFWDESNQTFTPSEVIYHLPQGKFGIYIRKTVVKAFKDRGVEITMSGSLQDKTLTRFIIL